MERSLHQGKPYTVTETAGANGAARSRAAGAPGAGA